MTITFRYNCVVYTEQVAMGTTGEKNKGIEIE